MNVYIAKNTQYDVRMASRSGGVFTAVSNVILSKNGIVYGCKLNCDNEAIHARADNIVERDSFRGSKYVQSNMNGCMVQVYSDLEENKFVLFTGTPCQVAGLLSYLNAKKADTQRLYTCTILCHYVTSPLLLREYLLECEKKWRGNVQKIDFRNKRKYGWDEHRETIVIRDKEHDSTQYTTIFYSGVATRESCFHCPYKNEHLPGNIVLADAWGVQTAAPDFNDNKGVSLVLVNDIKGQELFDAAQKEMIYRMVDFSFYNRQKAFQEPYSRPDIKDDFWRKYYECSYKEAYNSYLKVPFLKRLIRKIKRIFRGK